jgi:hypothetical protein
VATEVRFRAILPVAHCLSAITFGGFGLWERSAFLGRRVFGNGTPWNSSVASHYWPWPYKFAAVLNFPSVLAGLLLGRPVSELRPGLPESALFVLSLPFVALLWFGIGSWFDRKWGWMDGPPNHKLPWMLLLLFTLLCAAGASLYIESTSDYLLAGGLIWVVIGLAFTASTLYERFGRKLFAFVPNDCHRRSWRIQWSASCHTHGTISPSNPVPAPLHSC